MEMNEKDTLQEGINPNEVVSTETFIEEETAQMEVAEVDAVIEDEMDAVTDTTPDNIPVARVTRENVPNGMENLTPEEREQLMSLLQKTSYYAHPFMKATKQMQSEMFRDEAIVTEENASVETESTKLRKDLTELSASAKGGRVLEGKIVACRSANSANKIATNLAEVEYGNGTCTVLIPDFLLYDFDITNYRTPDGQKRVQQRLMEMIGTKIKFIVKQVDQKTKTAYADRLKAMEREAYDNYVRKLSSTGRTRIKVGDKIQARVTAVNRSSVTVNAFGSESRIRVNMRTGENEVSWNFTNNCRNLFRVNDVVNVRVLSISTREVQKYNEKYTLVDTQLSIKRAEENPQIKYFDEIQEEGIYAAIVTNVDMNNSIYVQLKGKIDCMCAFPRYGELPVVGQERVVRITEKKTETDTGARFEKDGVTPVRRIYGVLVDA